MPKKSKKSSSEGVADNEAKPHSAKSDKKVSKKMAKLAIALSSDEDEEQSKPELKQSKKGKDCFLVSISLTYQNFKHVLRVSNKTCVKKARNNRNKPSCCINKFVRL